MFVLRRFVLLVYGGGDESRTVELETVSVTANKISEDLNKIPQSLSVIDSNEFVDKEIKNVTELLKSVPSLYVASGNDERVNVRGLNMSLFTNSNPITAYVNGIPQSLSHGYSNLSMSNIERVEILRGPQSTIYGKDSIGGVINIVKKEPENEFSGTVGAEYGTGNYMLGSFETSGAVIEDKFYISLDGMMSKEDGWIRNELKNEDANDKQRRDLGLGLKFTPTDRLNLKLYANTNKHRDNFIDGIYIYPGVGAVDRANSIKRRDVKSQSYDVDTYNMIKTNSGSLSVQYEFDKFDLNWISTYKKTLLDSDFDAYFNDNPASKGLIYTRDMDIKTLSQELRLSSNENSPFKWIGGVYYEDEKTDAKFRQDSEAQVWGGVRYPASSRNSISDTKAKTAAVFGQISYPIVSNTELTIGGRYQQIKKDFDLKTYQTNLESKVTNLGFELNESTTWREFLPKVALSYYLNENLSFYASYAKGYLAGGYNYVATGEEVKNKFDPQKSNNYEIGIKGAYDRFRFSAAAYYMDIKNTHIYVINKDNTYHTGNADRSKSQGVELEGVFRATKEFDISLAASVSKTKYGNYVNWDGSNNRGNRIERTPSYKLNLGGSYLSPFGIYARADMNLLGKTYFNAKNTAKQDSYITLDAKIGFIKNNFDIYLYGKNLTNKEYIVNIVDAGGYTVMLNRGRVVGLGVKYNF
ncbi:TonB-dependent receptor [Campylobacter sp.]|uniref:TonB-dependent receptor n=1 Tax=Campylobacter sp. TaxID=205 RepID=UPI002707542F|nr:TonB-dependent receptor [Campylobacter sp.]